MTAGIGHDGLPISLSCHASGVVTAPLSASEQVVTQAALQAIAQQVRHPSPILTFDHLTDFPILHSTLSTALTGLS